MMPKTRFFRTLWILVAVGFTAAARADGPPTAEVQAKLRDAIARDLPDLFALYKDLHSHPELSLQETRTAGVLADRMGKLGFAVTPGVGGTGVVCVLKNGEGPVVMVRADMDALPVTEKTGLDYASKQEVRRADGTVVGVMHACGHDMHMTCWYGTACVLAKLKNTWQGTLVFIAQPAEELSRGAREMLNDGLYTRFPRPAFAFALHCDPLLPVGQIAYTEGPALANVDSVDITVKGRGGHGSMPHTTIDPVVIAARIVLDLQTIISREIDPLDAAVITVGSIHGGSKHNIIPASVTLQLTVRSFKDATRKHLLDGIVRVAKAAAAVARAPEPEFKLDYNDYLPALVNNPQLTRNTADAVRGVLGSENVHAMSPLMWGEDFGRYADKDVAICMLRLGTVAPEKIADFNAGGNPLPSLHSDLYAPDPEPSIQTGVLTLTVSAFNVLAKP